MSTVTQEQYTTIEPLDDRIVVRPCEAESTTSFGLVIPDAAQERPMKGEVVAVGPGRWSDQMGAHLPLSVKVGDIVLHSKFGGTEVSFNGEDLLILTSRDVLAVLRTVTVVHPPSEN